MDWRVWRGFDRNVNKKLAQSGERPKGMLEDCVGSQDTQHTVGWEEAAMIGYRDYKKVKVTLVQALRLCTGRTAYRVSRGIALSFHDHGKRRGEGSTSRPGRSLPSGKNLYPLYRRLGRPQGLSGQVQEFWPPKGFDPRTVQPVASRYTDYTTRPTQALYRTFNYSLVWIRNWEGSSCSWHQDSSLGVLYCTLKTRYLISFWGRGRVWNRML